MAPTPTLVQRNIAPNSPTNSHSLSDSRSKRHTVRQAYHPLQLDATLSASGRRQISNDESHGYSTENYLSTESNDDLESGYTTDEPAMQSLLSTKNIEILDNSITRDVLTGQVTQEQETILPFIGNSEPPSESGNVLLPANVGASVLDKEVLKYLPVGVCGSPILPSNNRVKFTGHLESAVRAFRDRSAPDGNRIMSQRLVERSLVERGNCASLNPNLVNDARIRIFALDDKHLDELLSGIDSLRATVHDTIACNLDAIIYDDTSTGEYSSLLRERVRNWFPSLEKIGEPSKGGYALKASFSEESELFVMKTPRDAKGDDVIHEAVVGFYALNKLRHILPNYMYVYGYTKCSPTIFNKQHGGTNRLTWHTSSAALVSYLISENIKDSVTMKEFVKDTSVTGTDLMAVFIQIFNALNVAYKSYGYTHYDLHHCNVMVRRYAYMIAIPYFGASHEIIGYIASSFVPYIIDYGYNRITVGGIGFGKIGLEQYDIEGERPFPMFDVYKIIAFTAESLYTSPIGRYYKELSNVLNGLFSFFQEGPLIDRVRKRISSKKDWYNISSDKRDITHDDYLHWLVNKSGLSIPIHHHLEPLVARGVFAAPINTELDTCAFYRVISSDSGPKTALEYCDTVAAIQKDTIMTPDIKQKAITWLNSRFDADSNYLKTIPQIRQSIQDAKYLKLNNQVVTDIMLPRLSNNPYVTNPAFVAFYKNLISVLIRIKDITTDVNAYIRADVSALIIQGKSAPYTAELQLLERERIELTSLIDIQREILHANVEYVSKVKWKEITNDNSVIKFWVFDHNNLVNGI